MSFVYRSIRVEKYWLSRRVGRLRTDYGVVGNEYSTWKSYDSMAKYQSIQSHLLTPVTR